MPALGGPSSTAFHSSGEKAVFDVIRSFFPVDVTRENMWSRSSPGPGRPTPAEGHGCAQRPARPGTGLDSASGRWMSLQCLVHQLAQLRADGVRAGWQELGEERDGQLFGRV